MKRNIARLLLFVSGALLLMIYSAPLVAGILNAGNLFGIATAGVLMFISIFFDKIISIVSAIWKKKLGKILVSLVSVLLCVFVVLFTVTLASVVANSHSTATDETTVLVLGCRVNGTTPSLMLRWRCNVAADYMLDNNDAVAILCGGQGNGEDITEAQCMHDIMVEQGIDESRLYMESTSTSTDENIANARKIIDANSLSTDVTIATSDYHEKRASIIAKKNNLTASSLSARGDRFSRPTFFTREVFGVWLQYL